MAPQKRSRRDADVDGEIIAVESASSSLQPDIHRKKARLSINQSPTSGPPNGREPSPAPSSTVDDASSPEPERGDMSVLPGSTQYEIMRDGGFKHLQNPDLDDARATQRFLARTQQIGDNHAADNAIIEEITCFNFMCHDRLHVQLGPLINFVVGLNGSGKSAILTAITLCLGGKAASTNRGASLKSLIKSGRDQAVLVVKLKNHGNDAYQPDVYGHSIIVERHFSKTGSSGYKLKNAMGRIISSKKSDVDDIIEYYQLQVDNPMNVLTQDAAKSFITQSTPVQKYKFFVEGVQLEALDNDYKLVSDTCDQIDGKLKDSAGDICELKKAWEAAKQKALIVQQHEKMREKARSLQRQAAWSQVEEVEAILDEKKSALATAHARIQEQERKAEEKGQVFQHMDEALERAKETERQVEEELAPMKEDEEAAKNAHDAVRKEIEKVHTQRREIKNSLLAGQKKVDSYKKDIETEMGRMEDANGGAQARKQAEIHEAEKCAADAETARKHNEDEGPTLQENHRASEEELEKLTGSLLAKRREVESVQRRLQELGQNQENVMAGYDAKMPQLLRMIQSERRFREKPVGPIGMHIKLLKPIWSNMIETTVGNTLNGFIVTKKSDQQLLSSMKRQLNMDFPILIGNHQIINTTGHEPDPRYETILRVLDIDNDLVRNQLIIGQAIEQSLLISSREEGSKIMFDGPKPRNVRQCFTLHDKRRDVGHRLGWMGRNSNSEIIPVHYNLRRRPRMKTDVDSQIAYQRESLNQLEREKNRLESECNQARTKIQRCEHAIMQHKRAYTDLKIDIQRANDHVEALQAELDRDTIEDGRLDALRGFLAEAERDLSIDQESYGNIGLEMEQLNNQALARRRELDSVKERLADHEAKLRKAQLKVRNTEQARKIALEEKNLAIALIEDFQGEKARAERKLEQQTEQVASFTEQASKISARVPVDEGQTPASLDAQINAIRDQLKAYNKRLGGSDHEINEQALEAKKVYEASKVHRDELQEILQLLKLSFMKRISMFRRFQRHISARSRINFNYLLSERAFRGKLTIDHVAKQLDVHVEPDETTKSSRGRQTKTLSGGEKSFCSICLLLSLWEAMGAPLRCLDEFDVFMDDVNRDVSTKMIISAARRSVGRQFILITPKALGAGAADAEDVHIIKLTDPRDKQRRIDEMLQDD
ncbi:Uncharacterized protein BP5553_08950 [Venustampulla echinocandica]|uniref:RecF/RecN/SMC N-terminal domain-containing protein n=1 Tax=Venustampulla echinocandica TaxID=2656787 RepID=A0A370TDI4_9HELO|nr:Uncharacterized protein BP5553_08950 [Venustampulla echinocandica]RDL32494.1 Uncharacterized protein BP5553_08950 [Venustampulla echinocandica]